MLTQAEQKLQAQINSLEANLASKDEEIEKLKVQVAGQSKREEEFKADKQKAVAKMQEAQDKLDGNEDKYKEIMSWVNAKSLEQEKEISK